MCTKPTLGNLASSTISVLAGGRKLDDSQPAPSIIFFLVRRFFGPARALRDAACDAARASLPGFFPLAPFQVSEMPVGMTLMLMLIACIVNTAAVGGTCGWERADLAFRASSTRSIW